MNKDVRRGLLIPIVAIIVMGFNLSNMEADCLRVIHFLTILIMGFALGMLTINLITYIKNKQARN